MTGRLHRTAFTRGRIAIVDRVDAVVAAMRINAVLTEARCPLGEPWAIIEMLKGPVIDRELIRKRADRLLGLRLEPAVATARLRALICQLENACGLHHDDRSVKAFLAGGSDASWRDYVMGLEAEAEAIEVTIPNGAEADHAHARA